MKARDEKIFKFAIIGGGAAGLYIASKLKNKSDLIIIESGDKNKYSKDNINHKFEVLKNSSHNLNTDQVAGLGGNTNLWGGQLLPFTKDDINKKNGWPFDCEELSSNYSTITKELLGQNINYFSRNYIEGIFNRKLIDLENKELKVHISSWLKEPNFKKIYKDIKRKIKILDNFFVKNIKYNNEGYYELECSNLFISKIIYAKKVVIACGAIQSVRLLINSSISNNSIIKNNLGKGFMDHSAINFIKLNVNNRFLFLKEFNTKILSNGNKLSIRMSASSQYLIRKRSNISGMILVLTPKNIIKRILNVISSLLSINLMNFVYKPFGEIYLCFHVEQEPNKFKYIKVNKNGNPIIRWNIDEKEVESVKDFGKIILKCLKKKKLIRNIPKIPSSKYIFSKMTDNNHPMGGAVMHLDKNKRVVDSNLEIIGHKGLYLCSTAVFPSGSHSNPTMTLLALADRLSDRLNTL